MENYDEDKLKPEEFHALDAEYKQRLNDVGAPKWGSFTFIPATQEYRVVFSGGPKKDYVSKGRDWKECFEEALRFYENLPDSSGVFLDVPGMTDDFIVKVSELAKRYSYLPNEDLLKLCTEERNDTALDDFIAGKLSSEATLEVYKGALVAAINKEEYEKAAEIKKIIDTMK